MKMTEEKCIFCNYELMRGDILWESENFFVKVGVGILGPGHIMIVTKKHITCFAELPKQLRKEFMLLKKDVFKRIKSNFSEPIIYEHGVYSQSIKHAHIHFVPIRNKLYNLENLKKNISNDIKTRKANNIFNVESIFNEEGSYFYLEENGQKWIFHTKGLPKGKFNFRKEFARLTGLHGLADWQNMPEEERQRNKEWVNRTKEVLKNANFQFSYI